ncbi:hypothetical protein [Actinoallomurus acaciae]|uniref:Uncharacterized protein n=1 Tax=Actinoallomurus acaciae TaxID=502577 RepID=A0ABV5Y8J6_9ACTN
MSSQQASGAVLPGTAASTVVVEVLVFRVLLPDGLAYRRLSRELHAGRRPDDVARGLLGLSEHATAHLLHSTSWRHEPADRVILTYACCPDPRPELPAVPLRTPAPARSAAPAAPSPEELTTGHVAAHAARHFAFLQHTDPIAHRVIASVPGLGDALARWSPATAGQLPAAARPAGRRP